MAKKPHRDYRKNQSLRGERPANWGYYRLACEHLGVYESFLFRTPDIYWQVVQARRGIYTKTDGDIRRFRICKVDDYTLIIRLKDATEPKKQ